MADQTEAPKAPVVDTKLNNTKPAAGSVHSVMMNEAVMDEANIVYKYVR